jgi:hypothetical protein
MAESALQTNYPEMTVGCHRDMQFSIMLRNLSQGERYKNRGLYC